MEIPSIIQTELDITIERGCWGVAISSRKLARKVYGTPQNKKPTKSQIDSMSRMLQGHRKYILPGCGWKVFLRSYSKRITYYFIRRKVYELKTEESDLDILDHPDADFMRI